MYDNGYSLHYGEGSGSERRFCVYQEAPVLLFYVVQLRLSPPGVDFAFTCEK